MIGAAWKWLTDSSNTLTVAAIGFIISVVGFAITLAGFAVAIRKLRKLQTATEAAKTAAEGVKLRVIQYDAANDATEARYALQSTRRHLDNDGWRDVADSYEDARLAMVRLLPILLQESEALGDEVRRMIGQIDKHCTVVERGVNDPGRQLPDKASLRSSLRRHLGVMHRVQQVLEQRVV